MIKENKNQQENTVEVSISCFTYNHVKFIRKTLDGFLMQKTNFNYEIIVHDDASVDGTTDILLEYQKKYPGIIRLILEEENTYSKTKSFETACRIMCTAVRGKYVAECDGDDQWIDDKKLQYQYDFMESHENVILCLHNGILNNIETGKQEKMVKGLETGFLSADETILIPHGFFPTASFFYRAEILKKLPEWYYQIPVGDDPLRYICMNSGDIYYMDEAWSIYNYMHDGSWNYKMNNLELKMEYFNGYLVFLKIFDEYSRGKFSAGLNQLMEYVCMGKVSLALPSKYKQAQLAAVIEQMKIETENKFDDQFDNAYLEKRKYCIDFLEESVETFVNQCNACNGKLYLYGAGEMAEFSAEVLENLGIRYQGFVVSDGHKQFELYRNHPVYELSELSEEKENVFIWLCLNKENTAQVLPQIESLGYEHVLYARYGKSRVWVCLSA